MRRTVSTANDEYVVNAPRKPVPKWSLANRSQPWSGPETTMRSSSRPSRNAPKRLTASVGTGMPSVRGIQSEKR